MKVLVIDDEPDIRKIAKLSLTRVGGMQVVEASGGPDGVRLAEAERPDAILLDVMMPGMDGPATLAMLKAGEATSKIPVVFLTAKAMTSELERLKALGAVAVLTKPFDPMTLPKELQAALQQPR
jgi:two-component system, OmpR family, response regulator